MDKQKTVWKAFMEIVNSKEIRCGNNRQEILQFITKYTEQYPRCFTVEQFSPNTVDYIRNLSEKVGYLDKTRHAGMYVVNKHFPSGYTVSQLRKDYDSGTW